METRNFIATPFTHISSVTIRPPGTMIRTPVVMITPVESSGSVNIHDNDIALAPVEVAPAEHAEADVEPWGKNDAGSRHNQSWQEYRERWEQGKPPVSVNNVWIVGGNVNIVHADRLDTDDSTLNNHDLFFRSRKISRLARSYA